MTKGERWKQAEARRAARDRLRAARAALKEARTARRAALPQLRAEARAARAAAKERARELRRELIERHRAERASLRLELSAARRALRTATIDARAALAANVRDLEQRVRRAADDLAWVSKRKVVRGHRGLTAAEAREHERTTTRAELTHEWERELFDSLYNANRIRGTERRSLGESFAEWMHDHSADVWAARERHAAERLEQLEREEHAASRSARGRRPRVVVFAAPAADEWGG